MPYSRIRTQGGTVARNGEVYSPITKVWSAVNSSQTVQKTCNDTVGNFKGDNVLLITESAEYDRSMDGSTPSGWHYRRIFLWDYAIPGHRIGDSLSGSAINAAALSGQGKTNPNRPHINVPTFIGELKDLPGLVKGAGISHLKRLARFWDGKPFAKEVASKHLEYRWGLKPMISDAKKIFGFARALEKKRGELGILRSGRSLNKTVTLESSTSQQVLPEQTLWSQGGTVRGYRTDTSTRRVWVSVKWVADASAQYPQTAEPWLSEAEDLLYGLNTEGAIATAWELLPWSWLVDWFLNLSDLMAAKGNTFPVKPVSTCVMVHTKTISMFAVTKVPSGVTVSGRVGGYRETKRRTPCATPTPINLSLLPLVEADKWSILGSLALQRVR